MPLKPPIDIPRNNRDFTRWCQEQQIVAEDGTVDTSSLQDDAVTTAKIADANVTLAKLADMTADRILGRLTTDGVPTELTAAQVVGLLQEIAWVFGTTAQFDANVGFYGTTPVAQQSDTGLVSPSTVNGTGDDTTINSNFGALATAINDIRTVLNNLGLTA